LACKKVLYEKENENKIAIFQETAHPSKFTKIVNEVIDVEIEIPESLKELLHRKKQSIEMGIDYESFRNYLNGLD